LTNPAKQNIIPSIRGSKRQVADIKSEPRPASNRNQWPASFWNAWPASSESAIGSFLAKSGVKATDDSPNMKRLAKAYEALPFATSTDEQGTTDTTTEKAKH
jgi:hypothetical protein